jgi:hypothetical protein
MNLFAQIRQVVGELGQLPARLDANLQQRLARPLPGLRRTPIRPAEVSRKLEKIMLARENMLEDANYGLVVPNDYVVEVSQALYDQGYRPIEQHLCDQWQSRLLDRLITANSRIGEKKYRFGGPVQIRIQPAAGLVESQVRVQGSIKSAPGAAQGGPDGAGARPDRAGPRVGSPGTGAVGPGAAASLPDAGPGSTVQLGAHGYLALLPGGPRYPLRPGLMTIGRGPACDIHLSQPDVQQERLVSGLHAHIRCEGSTCRLYDGAPGGYPSSNGTFVNGNRLGTEGRILNDGDVIVLAATDPLRPRPDVRGSAGFVFYAYSP